MPSEPSPSLRSLGTGFFLYENLASFLSSCDDASFVVSKTPVTNWNQTMNKKPFKTQQIKQVGKKAVKTVKLEHFKNKQFKFGFRLLPVEAILFWKFFAGNLILNGKGVLLLYLQQQGQKRYCILDFIKLWGGEVRNFTNCERKLQPCSLDLMI